MRFEIVDRQGYIPELHYGGPGRELAGFIPDGLEWTQLSYDNGGGQALIRGHRWGFYYAGEGFSIVLESGVETIHDATLFVAQVRDKLFGENSHEVQVLLAGDQYAEAEAAANGRLTSNA